jgi:hypothetical protein
MPSTLIYIGILMLSILIYIGIPINAQYTNIY